MILIVIKWRYGKTYCWCEWERAWANLFAISSFPFRFAHTIFMPFSFIVVVVVLIIMVVVVVVVLLLHFHALCFAIFVSASYTSALYMYLITFSIELVSAHRFSSDFYVSTNRWWLVYDASGEHWTSIWFRFVCVSVCVCVC